LPIDKREKLWMYRFKSLIVAEEEEEENLVILRRYLDPIWDFIDFPKVMESFISAAELEQPGT
jgi:hypothetical protein